jgi:anaerobic dimethyl sulfoxide reductase subunit A
LSTYPVFCGKDCGGNACPMLATVEAGRITRITHNPAGGDFLIPCRRGLRLANETYAPERLLHPLIRTGPRGSGQFRRASWEEALDLTAARLTAIRDQHGPSAVLNRGSAGVTGALHATYGLLSRFLNLFGGCTVTTGNYSNAAAGFILPYVLGSSMGEAGFDNATMRHAEMIILWGANVLETRQGTGVPEHLFAARQRGTQIVVIDPRRSATVQRAATWWLPCQPGTDAALMLAVLHVLFSENLADRTFIAAHSVGFEALERYVLGQAGEPPRSPEWAEAICGLDAQEIKRFARAYAAAQPAMLFPGYAIQRVYAGEESYRLTVALQVATGNFGRLGGSTGAINSRLPGPRHGRLPVPRLPDLPSVPVLRWPDAVLEGRAGGYPSNIHAMYVLGANAINQGGDVNKSIAAFEQLDFAVTHELFMTPTARYCDVVFPAATALEKSDIGEPWAGNYLLYKPRVLPPAGEARSDYDILWALAERMGFGEAFSEGRTQDEWIEHFIAESDIPDPVEFKRSGIYLGAEQERSGLSAFAANPRAHPLATPSGLVEIASQRYHAETGFPAIPTWQPAPANPRYPLRLISPKSPERTHSQGDQWAESRPPAQALEMHPADAAARGLEDGQKVRLFNDQGQAHVTLRITADLMPGVVCLLEGVWVELDANGIDQAGAPNLFTTTTGTTPGLACIMHGIGVEVV